MKNSENKIRTEFNNFFKECKKCRKDECKGKYKEKFSFDTSLSINLNYFKSKNKLLIVGQEAVEKPKKHEIFREMPYGNNLHWKITVLEAIRVNYNFDNRTMDIIEHNNYLAECLYKQCGFAFTDYFKCCFLNNNKTVHTQEMRTNCFFIFEKELNFLKPDIIIAQGTEVVNAINSNLKNIVKYKKTSVDKIYLSKLEKFNKKIYILNTPFPQYRGSYKWNYIRDIIYDLIGEVIKKRKK